MKLKDLEAEMEAAVLVPEVKEEEGKMVHLLPATCDPCTITPHQETSVTVHWPGRRTFDGGRVKAPIGTEVLASYPDGSKTVVVVDEDGQARYARQSPDGHLGGVEDDGAMFRPLWTRKANCSIFD